MNLRLIIASKLSKSAMGNAKELWLAGIRDIQTQHKDLSDITPQIQATKNAALIETHQQAMRSTQQFVLWLKK